MVIIVNVKSNPLTTNIGAPQGTILDSLLFLIYQNDIFNKLPIESIVLIECCKDNCINSKIITENFKIERVN